MDDALHNQSRINVSLPAFVFLQGSFAEQRDIQAVGVKRRVGLDEFIKKVSCTIIKDVPEQAARALITVIQTAVALGEADAIPYSEYEIRSDESYPKKYLLLADDEFGNVLSGVNKEQLAAFDIHRAVELAKTGNDKKQILDTFFSDYTVKRCSVCGFEKVLAFGSRGEQVRRLQNGLNRVSLFKPSIPKLRPDGIYGSNTEQAVKSFQAASMLEADGIAGRRTLTRLFYACDKAERLLFCNISPNNFDRIPVPGSKGEDTKQLQLMLMALSLFHRELDGFYDAVNAQLGFYGEDTALCVSTLQSMLGSTVNGICSMADMIKIRSMYEFTARYIPKLKRQVPYPGRPLTQGCVGDEVLAVGQCLLEISVMYPEIPCFFLCDVFTSQMQKAVFQLQNLFMSKADGIIDQDTWLVITQKSYDIEVAKYCVNGQCPITQ